MSRAQKHSLDDDGPTPRAAEAHKMSGVHDMGRSCINCHKRKVRCDRKTPCSQCVRSKWSCIYPNLDQETAKRSSPLQDITSRLDRLESRLLEVLEKQTSALSLPGESSQPNSEPAGKRVRIERTDSQRWEVLLRHGNRVHYVDNRNLLDLFQDVLNCNANSTACIKMLTSGRKRRCTHRNSRHTKSALRRPTRLRALA